MNPVIVWFRQDLRIDDNPALYHATKSGAPIVAVYVWSPNEEGKWRPGGASRVWLHFSLVSLKERLRKLGGDLVIREGDTAVELVRIARAVDAKQIFWNDRYEPEVIERDETLKKMLKAEGLESKTFDSALLFDAEAVRTQQGAIYRVFTPFWNRCQELSPIEPLPQPKRIDWVESMPKSMSVEELKLLPTIHWDTGIRKAWDMGETGGRKQLKQFMADIVHGYDKSRNLPAEPGTSRLSPYLHFGEISVRRAWYELKDQLAQETGSSAAQNIRVYLRELGWREFAYHTLIASPESPDLSWRREFENLPTVDDNVLLKAWQKGLTGYPIVDAGMRELWETGWMHNRVRMIVGSFLTKDLLISWQRGAEWFWDTLVDADLANNTMGWQWVAGSGVDAMPYIRVFNPITQSEKFDSKGAYIRKWVPELKRLPDKMIHEPWSVPEAQLKHVGIKLGVTYPKPIVDHAVARQRALEAFSQVKRSA